ncbi:MAG: hypothetical protein IPK26_29815 [Planctomycetes bacterium]|nr:hypothetical protein [Planctomycetota bacterium]
MGCAKTPDSPHHRSSVTVDVERGTIGTTNANLVNLGTIRIARSGGALTVTGAEWENRGTLEGSAGTTVTTGGSWTNLAIPIRLRTRS